MKYSAGALSHEKIMRCIELYGRGHPAGAGNGGVNNLHNGLPEGDQRRAGRNSFHLACHPGVTHLDGFGIDRDHVGTHPRREAA